MSQLRDKTGHAAWSNPRSLAVQFLADHVRLEDMRLYLRDLLREYAALQTFQPFRSEEARCMNWDRMLAEFSAPHRRPSYVRLAWKPHAWLSSACSYNPAQLSCTVSIRERRLSCGRTGSVVSASV